MNDAQEIQEAIGPEEIANAVEGTELELTDEGGVLLRFHDLPEAGAIDPQRFIVDDDDKANWALRKLAKIEAEEKRIQKNYEMEMQRLASWRDEKLAKLKGPRSFFEGLLFGYMRILRANHEKENKPAKSFRYDLPLAVLRIKDQDPKYERDEKVLVDFFEANGYINYVNAKEVKSPNWATFKDLLKTGGLKIEGSHLIDTATGQKIEGIEVIERPAKLEFDFEPGVVS